MERKRSLRTAEPCSRVITAQGTTRIPVDSTRACSRWSSSARWRSNVLSKAPVKLWPPVAEEAEGCAVLFCLGKVERRDQYAGLASPELRENVAAVVADEAVAVKALPVLRADAVGRDHGHDVRDCMADHRAPPQP